MSAERLRAAATRLREVAGGATPGPWDGGERCVWGLHLDDEIVVDGDNGTGGVLSPSDADYIAMMSPPVALALADWLDDLADHDPSPLMPTEAGAFKVADAVLGGEER